MNKRIVRAIEHLGEDEGLTSDLVDSEAIVLLNWAQRELQRWGSGPSALNDATFAMQFKRLRMFMHLVAKKCAGAANPAAALQAALAEAPGTAGQPPSWIVSDSDENPKA